MTKEIGQRIQAIRGDRSRSSYADKLGVHQNTLRRYEVGERGIEPELLIKISKMENINPGWLLMGSGPMYMQDCPHQPFAQSPKKEIEKTPDMAEKLIAALQDNVLLVKENSELKLELERMKAQVAELKRQVEKR